jgi:hypothetical protein
MFVLTNKHAITTIKRVCVRAKFIPVLYPFSLSVFRIVCWQYVFPVYDCVFT